MVAIVENWAVVAGVVLSIDSGVQAGLRGLTLRVEEAADVPGFPNLLKAQVGGSITLMIPPHVLPTLKVGDRVTGKIRQGGPSRFFADPATLRIVPPAG